MPLVSIGDIPNADVVEGDRAQTARASEGVSDSAHPQGINGCRDMSPFNTPYQEKRAYSAWCKEEVGKQVTSLCQGTGTEAEELACAETYMADWKDYGHRQAIVCMAISTTSGQDECSTRNTVASLTSLFGIIDEWPPIYAAMNADPEVSAAYQKTVECLTAKSFTANSKLLFYWQKYYWDEQGINTFLDGLTKSEFTLMESLVEPSQQCAVKEGLFVAQEAALIAEVTRLSEADPEKVSGLKTWGVLEALNETGVTRLLREPYKP